MTERERAERFLDNGTFAVKSWNEIFRELEMPEPTRQLLICDLMAFAREERARVWEEAADRVGPHDDLYFEWRLKAKMLREEGGNHVQDRRTRENRRVRL